MFSHIVNIILKESVRNYEYDQQAMKQSWCLTIFFTVSKHFS